ncbi:hypothetical protein DFQ26_005459 [Actinomortierella ambigua]|nr:hypothetical protein DFQ26_005459 [Actinomortierella ambigua]
MKRSASEINAENEALEALLRDRVNSLTERLRVLTQQTKDVYDQTKTLANVFHEKQKRLYQIEDHLLRLQGKPGLSELYLENGSQPRRLTKELDDLRMGVKTLRRKFQAAGNVVATAGWWRHLHADTDTTNNNNNNNSTSTSATSSDASDDKPLSPVLVASPVSLTPTTRQGRSTISLQKIFTSPVSPTSTSFPWPHGSSASLVSPRDGTSRDPYLTSPASERANPSLGLRSPPPTPKTTSSTNPLFKGLGLAGLESKLHANLPSVHDHKDDHDPPVVMMATTTVDADKGIPPLLSGRPGTTDIVSDLRGPPAVKDGHVAPPSPVNTASDAEEEAFQYTNHKQARGGESEQSRRSTQEHQSDMADDAHIQDTMEETPCHVESSNAAISTAITTKETAALSDEGSDLIPVNKEGEGERDDDNHNDSNDTTNDNDDDDDSNDINDDNDNNSDNDDDWEEIKDDTPQPHAHDVPETSTSDLSHRDQQAQEQPAEQTLGWTQRLWLFLVRIEYILLGTAVFGTTLPDNPIAFCTGFVSAMTFAVVLVGRWLLRRGEEDSSAKTTSHKTHRVVFTSGRSSTPRYRALASSSLNRSPASTLSRRRGP